MIWADRQRTDGTLRKFIDSNGNEQNVHIEEIEANITQNGTPVNSTTMNLIEKNIGTYGNDTYDNTATYEIGDRVTYLGRLYRCIEEIDTPEEFDNEKWDETSALEELNNAGGNEIAIGTDNITNKTKLLIETDTMETLGTEVVDTLEGNERNRAPSVNAVKDKLVNVNNNIGILTNLTTTEKSNLVGAINEIDGDLSNLETYSTSEKKIGTWIDGKPLYRKVISQSSKNDVNLSGLNYNYLAIVYTIITIASTPHPYIRNPYYTSGTDYFRTLLTPVGNLIIETSHSSITNWTTVIEYTKTTD